MALKLPTLDEVAAERKGKPIPKPAPREKKLRRWIRVKAKPKAERDRLVAVRQYVFARERDICRCCRLRPAESRHEIRSRSLGGKVSRRNSIAVCGQLGNGPECHGMLQRKDIRVVGVIEGTPDAEYTLWFYPETAAAREWIKIGEAQSLESAPMVQLEAAE